MPCLEATHGPAKAHGNKPSAADVCKAALALAAIYSGSGRSALAMQLGVSRAAVPGVLASLLAALPGARAWWERAWAGVEARGWVATAAGRRWPVPGVGRMAPRVRPALQLSHEPTWGIILSRSTNQLCTEHPYVLGTYLCCDDARKGVAKHVRGELQSKHMHAR